MAKIELNGSFLEYELRASRRARRLGLTVYPGGRIVLTVPVRTPESHVERFLQRYGSWLRKMHAKNKRVIAVLPRGKKDFQEHKQRALRLARERLRHFNQWYGYAIGNVSVRNNKTRWGSCSRKGDISFNYQIAHLDPLLADYVIVHELCHIGQFNHSKAFWELVARTIPDHVERRKKLRLVSH